MQRCIVTSSYRFFCSCILSISGCVACSSPTMLAVSTPSSLFNSRISSWMSCISRSLIGIRSLHIFSDLVRFDIVSCLAAADCFSFSTSASRIPAWFVKSAVVLEYLRTIARAKVWFLFVQSWWDAREPFLSGTISKSGASFEFLFFFSKVGVVY